MVKRGEIYCIYIEEEESEGRKEGENLVVFVIVNES